jgi:hypothetical protein
MNIEESSGVRGRLAALLDHSDDLHLLLLGEFGAPTPNAALLACGLQAGASALPQHRPLKLSEGSDHLHHHSSRCRGRVDGLGQAAKTNLGFAR